MLSELRRIVAGNSSDTQTIVGISSESHQSAMTAFYLMRRSNIVNLSRDKIVTIGAGSKKEILGVLIAPPLFMEYRYGSKMGLLYEPKSAGSIIWFRCVHMKD